MRGWRVPTDRHRQARGATAWRIGAPVTGVELYECAVTLGCLSAESPDWHQLPAWKQSDWIELAASAADVPFCPACMAEVNSKDNPA